MGWLAKIFGAASKQELDGLRLDTSNGFWVVGKTIDLPKFLKALHFIIDENYYLFFEGGNPNKELAKFIKQNQVSEQENIARGTLWPKQSVVHLPSNKSVIDKLVGFANNASPFEFGIHFHIYKKGQVILEWHDAFTQEMLLSKELPEQCIRAFADELGVDFKYENGIEPSHALDSQS